MIRILQVLPNLEIGGVERSAIQTAISIKNNKMIPVVVSNGGKMVKELDDENIQHIKLWVHSKNPLIILVNAFILILIILLKNINIIHARSRAPAWSCWIACKLTGCMFVTTFHGFYSGYNNCLKNKYNKIMTYGEKTIVSTSFMQKHLIENYKLNPEKIIIIPRGVNTNNFKNINQKRIDVLKKKYNIKSQKVITLPGRLTDWKGQKIFLRAIKLLNIPNSIFLIIGKGNNKYKKELFDFIKKHDLNVIIDEKCEDIPALYQLSDIIVSASTDNETFGRVSVEGQASGKVVIATNIGGSKETIINNKSGILIEPNNPKILAEKIKYVLNNNINLRKNAIENSKKFDISTFETNVINFYKLLIKN